MVSKRCITLIMTLLDPYSSYYSDGYLNSEGMTILSVIAKEVLREYPYLKGLFEKARKRRSYEDVSRILNEVLTHMGLNPR